MATETDALLNERETTHGFTSQSVRLDLSRQGAELHRQVWGELDWVRQTVNGERRFNGRNHRD